MLSLQEVKVFFILSIGILFLFFIFILSLILLIKKKQREIQLKNQLKEEQFKSELLRKELENKKVLDAERERISMDLHDDLGANLSAIGLKADYLISQSEDEKLKSTLKEIVENTQEVGISMREMMWSLNAKKDNLEDFVGYVKQYCQNYYDGSGIQIAVLCPSIKENFTLSSFTRRQLFLSIKEANHNILKHSHASQVRVDIQWNEPKLSIMIQDNGKGFSGQTGSGNGLLSMRRRMESIQGVFHIQSDFTNGTVILLELGLEN